MKEAGGSLRVRQIFSPNDEFSGFLNGEEHQGALRVLVRHIVEDSVKSQPG
jgi:hypothetical protein